jgi:hypothetical protein
MLFAGFVSVFALDVFDNGLDWLALTGFLIHLTPVYLLVAILVVAWRHEWIGAIFYPILAGIYILVAPGFPPSVYLIMMTPLLLLGGLFFAHWIYSRKHH